MSSQAQTVGPGAEFGVHDVVVVEHIGSATRIATESAATLVDLTATFLNR